MNKNYIKLFFLFIAGIGSQTYCMRNNDKTKYTGTKEEKVKDGFVRASPSSRVMMNYITGEMIKWVSDKEYIVVMLPKKKK